MRKRGSGWNISVVIQILFLAEAYTQHYPKLSIYDCVALAMAKDRGIALLTGDGPLRKAAKEENVPVVGTIGILDQLYGGEYIKREEYLECLIS